MINAHSALKTLGAVLFIALTLTRFAFGDEVPSFSEPQVNSFVKSYAQFVDDLADAYRAIKAGDNSKLPGLQSKSQELQNQAADVAGKVKPDEAQRFSDFIAKCAQRIEDITKQ